MSYKSISKELYEVIHLHYAHTFSWERFSVINKIFEGERNTQKLHIAVSVPDQEFLAGSDLFAGLIEYLAFTLDRDQVLLLGEARALHQGHPIPWSASSIHKVTQAAVLKDLSIGKKKVWNLI